MIGCYREQLRIKAINLRDMQLCEGSNLNGEEFRVKSQISDGV